VVAVAAKEADCQSDSHPVLQPQDRPERRGERADPCRRASNRQSRSIFHRIVGHPNPGSILTDVPAANFSIFRLKRDVLRRSSIGIIATNRSRLEDAAGSNQIFGADAAFAFYENLKFDAYLAKSWTAARAARTSAIARPWITAGTGTAWRWSISRWRRTSIRQSGSCVATASGEPAARRASALAPGRSRRSGNSATRARWITSRIPRAAGDTSGGAVIRGGF